MQNADIVLSIIQKNSSLDSNYKFDRLYRNFFNKDFYLSAYGKIYAKEGNMTKGVDDETIDGFGMNRINKIIEHLKNETYYFKPSRRVYIPKKNNNGERPLGIPTSGDKIVQEITRSILDAIYEPIFSENSHGFRPDRSCHTALKQIKREWTGVKWVIEGDIKGFFDNIDHNTMLNILKEKIEDGRFIELIRRMLVAGYIEDWVYNRTYSGTPQGGIVSPILANIYLDKLDKYMEEVIIPTYETSKKKRKDNPVYAKINHNMLKLSKTIKTLDKLDPKRSELLKQYIELRKERRKHKVKDPMDNGFVRIKYVRYADDFVVGIIGSKELATEIRTKIANYLNETLKLTLSLEKTHITNFGNKHKPVKFLGYEIYSSNDDSYLVRRKDGRVARAINGLPRLRMPSSVFYDKSKAFMRKGKAIHRPGWHQNDLAEIISRFASEIRGLYNYYRMADNVAYQMGKFRYYHRSSLIKTIAHKMDKTAAQVVKEYKVDDTIGVIVKRKPPKKDVKYKYYDGGFEKNDFIEKANYNAFDPDIMPNNNRFVNRNGLIKRLVAHKCEHCGIESEDITDFEVHHVKKLKDLKKKFKGKKQPPFWVQQMITRNRKTLVVCKKCHIKIHTTNSN